jgi:hypothetical protein
MAPYAIDERAGDLPAGSGRASPPPDILTAEETAGLLRVRRAWVYANARQLGGWRLLGDRGPWRFSRRALVGDDRQTAPEPNHLPAQARGSQAAELNPSIPLLPIRRRRI